MPDPVRRQRVVLGEGRLSGVARPRCASALRLRLWQRGGRLRFRNPMMAGVSNGFAPDRRLKTTPPVASGDAAGGVTSRFAGGPFRRTRTRDSRQRFGTIASPPHSGQPRDPVGRLHRNPQPPLPRCSPSIWIPIGRRHRFPPPNFKAVKDEALSGVETRRLPRQGEKIAGAKISSRPSPSKSATTTPLGAS